MFDYSKLLGRMTELGYTQMSLAEEMGKNKGTISAKINGHSFFTTAEIAGVCKVLKIPIKDIPAYFFAAKV
jgi:transcriptional regulator with XRE-family HTH domain